MPKDIEYLIEGHNQFRKKYFESEPHLYQDLVENGQRPRFIVIACSDSRVDPSIILNCRPGDLFVIRNVANLVPPCEQDNHYHGTSAALEFGVCALQIKHIIVLGHTQCGGILSLIDKQPQTTSSFITQWMQLAKHTCEIAQKQEPDLPREEQADHCAKHSILNSLENLKTFPWIAQRLPNQKIFLHGWFFDFVSGQLMAYDEKIARFARVHE